MTKAMTKVEALKRLKALSADDAEYAHIEADKIMVAYVRANASRHVADAFEAARSRIGFWYA